MNEDDKVIKVPAEIHKDIKVLAAQEDREMREIVKTAYEFYKAYRQDRD